MAEAKNTLPHRDSPIRGSFILLLLYCSLMALVVKVNGNALNASYYHYEVEQEADQHFVDVEEVLKLSSKMVKGKANLTAITWAHAVNSQQLLDEVLSSGAIDFIEADIVLGQLNGEGNELPIMAHPPIKTSDLSLEAFLTQIKVYNDLHPGAEKGVKLDFKSIEVFEGSLEILDANIPNMNNLIWINADIISGPVEQNSTVPVDPDRFFAGCVRYKQALLSIGWTTKWGSDYRDGEYTKSQCDAMLDTLNSNNVLSTGQGITFPVRAGIAANSAEQLHQLVASVNQTNDCTLTIWSSNNDYVDVPLLRKLIYSFGLDRVYLDVPQELASQLDLGNPGNSAGTFNSLVSFSFVSICFWALTSWLQSV